MSRLPKDHYDRGRLAGSLVPALQPIAHLATERLQSPIGSAPATPDGKPALRIAMEISGRPSGQRLLGADQRGLVAVLRSRPA
jgi:hypothetical protein